VAQPILWDGRYVDLGAAVSGDVITVTFPIRERTVHAQIGEGFYTLTLKGNEVVAIDPPGKKLPSISTRSLPERQSAMD